MWKISGKYPRPIAPKCKFLCILSLKLKKKIGNPGIWVLRLKTPIHCSGKNPGFKPGSGTQVQSLIGVILNSVLAGCYKKYFCRVAQFDEIFASTTIIINKFVHYF